MDCHLFSLFKRLPQTVYPRKWCALALALFLSAGTSSALAATYMARSADGVMTFSDVPMNGGQVHRRAYFLQGNAGYTVQNPCSGLNEQALESRAQRLQSQFADAARKYDLDVALIKAVAHAESCFDPSAISRVGAKGIMQLMPATATEMGVQDIFDQRQNLHGGAKYLASMLQRYSNNLELALAAYNAGPGNVDKYNGVPPFQETERYIRAVVRYRDWYAGNLLANN